MSIYLDHNATSPMHAEVVDAMLPFLENPVGNPSSPHAFGRKPRQALISGGDQEHRRRAGTENVAGIVGLGKAAELARLEISGRKHHLEQLRDLFDSKLSQIASSVVFGQKAPRLPNRSCFTLASGSARHSAATGPSHVSKAMGVDDQIALNANRISFGTGNNLRDVDKLASKLQQLVDGLPAVVRRAAA